MKGLPTLEALTQSDLAKADFELVPRLIGRKGSDLSMVLRLNKGTGK